MIDNIAVAVFYGAILVVASATTNETQSSEHADVNIEDETELERALLLAFNSTRIAQLINANNEQQKNDWKLFIQAMAQFKRWYNTADELEERFKIFQSNMRLGEKLKENDLTSATYGVTKFFDMTPEEFLAMRGISSPLSNTPPRLQKQPKPSHHNYQEQTMNPDSTKKDKKKIRTFMHLF
uniref:Inhibitor_I29 domain-containing protein n=1 Tax=Trichuris muris TaxID=70415 RepID=A0A5S6QX91_TRIMR